jgi:ABC-2 type transport system ATP-binding protein
VEPILHVRDLEKTFRIGFFRKRVEAVRGVSFEVRSGEIFGLLGPNGAGKTTTIKAVLGLIFPNRGTVRLFGQAVGPAGLRRVGYLPENPYVYQYLRPLEFLDLCGRLCGMAPAARRARADELLERVGLADAVDRAIGKFSKGMMQRIGLAQALLHDPELLILDEPMSGLDPVGRKEVRDLILAERQAGRTILFSTHILGDVEMLCDHVTILRRGRLVVSGALSELLRAEVQRTELTVLEAPEAFEARWRAAGHATHRAAGRLVIDVTGSDASQEILADALGSGLKVASVVPRSETLEDLFVREAIDGG